MKKTLLLSLFVLGLSALGLGQVQLVPITLSSAVTSASTNTVVVSAATGLNSNSYSIAAGTSYLYVDAEYMSVSQVNGTTLTVVRGYGGTRAATHAASAYVYAGPATAFFNAKPGVLPYGSCTRSSQTYTPHIEISAQVIFDCVGGEWQGSPVVPYASQSFAYPFPPVGGTLYTGINTNGTTLGATTMYCTEIDLPISKVVTGLGVLNGTTVGTDKHLVALYDATGNLIANSATAGATAATASEYQQFAFTNLTYVVGPAKYFGCMQTNGTTATVRMAVTGQADTYLTKGITAMTFGTIPATITVPTTFTTAVGPFFEVY